GFRHALLAEAVYDDLLPGERVRIHAAYAAALAKQEVDGAPAELARHARESHDLVTAFHASVRAGDEAMGVAAPQEAVRHSETALELIDQVPEAEQECDQLALVAADAAAAAGHQLRALNLVQTALNELPETSPDQTRAELLYAFATYALTTETDVDAFAA